PPGRTWAARPLSKVFSLPDDAEQPAQFANESQEPNVRSRRSCWAYATRTSWSAALAKVARFDTPDHKLMSNLRACDQTKRCPSLNPLSLASDRECPLASVVCSPLRHAWLRAAATGAAWEVSGAGGARSAWHRMTWQELTATMTATTATSRDHRRAPAAIDALVMSQDLVNWHT